MRLCQDQMLKNFKIKNMARNLDKKDHSNS